MEELLDSTSQRKEVVAAVDVRCWIEADERLAVDLRLDLAVLTVDYLPAEKRARILQAESVFSDRATGFGPLSEPAHVALRAAVFDALRGKIALSLFGNERLRAKTLEEVRPRIESLEDPTLRQRGQAVRGASLLVLAAGLGGCQSAPGLAVATRGMRVSGSPACRVGHGRRARARSHPRRAAGVVRAPRAAVRDGRSSRTFPADTTCSPRSRQRTTRARRREQFPSTWATCLSGSPSSTRQRWASAGSARVPSPGVRCPCPWWPPSCSPGSGHATVERGADRARAEIELREVASSSLRRLFESVFVYDASDLSALLESRATLRERRVDLVPALQPSVVVVVDLRASGEAGQLRHAIARPGRAIGDALASPRARLRRLCRARRVRRRSRGSEHGCPRRWLPGSVPRPVLGRGRERVPGCGLRGEQRSRRGAFAPSPARAQRYPSMHGSTICSVRRARAQSLGTRCSTPLRMA